MRNFEDDPVREFFDEQRQQIVAQQGSEIHWQSIIRRVRARRRSGILSYAAAMTAAGLVIGGVTYGAFLHNGTSIVPAATSTTSAQGDKDRPKLTRSPARPATSTPAPRVTTAAKPVGPPIEPAAGPSTARASCDGTALTLKVADAIGYGTGQTAWLITVRNSGQTACSLRGYPHLTLLNANGKELPFRIHYGGSQSVTNHQPEAVTIRPGGSALVTFGQYRCDIDVKAQAKEVKVTLPNTAAPTALDLTTLSSYVAYCGPGDPGSELAVSPVEPTEAKTRQAL